MAVGQISGPLLKSNLIRNGIDLAFDTDLLYLEVNTRKIGIRTNTPTHDLTVNGTTKTTTLEVNDQLSVGDISIASNTISSVNSTITLTPAGANPVVYQGALNAGNLAITQNTISSIAVDSDINITPDGTGEVNIASNTEIVGDLHITGIITATGTINSENVTLAGGVDGNMLPVITDFYNLGSSTKRWKEGWINNIYSDTISTSNLIVDGINLSLRVGNILYVSTNGSNSRTGTHQNDPVQTLKYALSIATAGTTVYIFPGTYTEIFPMTVPAGVAVKGTGLRSVVIQPTNGTNTLDAFLLNGETIVEDLTVSNFFYDSVNNTGHAFRFANNMTVTTKSPYIKNVSVITKGSVTSLSDPLGFDQGDAGRGAFLDGSVVNASSKEATGLFYGVTLITPNADALVLRNGVRVEWLNSFTYFANRGIYATAPTTGFAGQGKTAIRVSETTGTFTAGQTLTSYAADGTTILSQGVISSVSGSKIFLNGKVAGLQEKTEIKGKIVTAVGNAQLSTTIKKFGLSAARFQNTVGSGSAAGYLTIPSHTDFAFGTGDFTIEFFMYITATGNIQILFDMRQSQPEVAIQIQIDASNYVQFYVNGVLRLSSTNPISLNVMTHVALAKSVGVTKLFVQGLQQGTTYTTNDNFVQRPINIGARFNGTFGFNGYIDEIRVSKGIAKYTASFAPTTSQFSRTGDTVLLLHCNGTAGSQVFEDDSFILQDIRTATGTAHYLELVDYTDFGAEVRSMSSANIYGNYGVYGDGYGVIMYLVGQNFAYVGSGKDSNNDNGLAIQANEVVETNGAKIYYSSVDQKGDFRVGELFYVNQSTGEVQFTTANFNINSDQGLTLSNGVDTTYIDGTKLETGDIRISGNTIQTLTTNLNLLSAGDQINLQNNVNVTGDLTVGGNLAIGGNITIGDQVTDTVSFVAGITSDLIPRGNFNLGSNTNRWNDVYTNNLVVDQIQLTGSTIQSLVTDGVLTLAATGSGFIKFENLEVQDNEIRSVNNDNLVLKPNGTGVVYIDSTQSLRVPSGNTSQRSGTAGSIRFNTQTSHFEGYDGTNWLTLDGIYDLDLNTYISTELIPGANDGTIRFYSNGSLVADLNSTRFRADRLDVGTLRLDGNTLSSTTPNTNISLQTSGTGSVILENFAIKNNVITNTVNNSNTTFVQTGTGYFKFQGATGLVIPVGNDANRPPIAEVGMLRYTTTTKRVEVYNGSAWINSAGESTANITVGEAERLAIDLVITLG